MTCSACNAIVPDGARFCPACGAARPRETEAGVAAYSEALTKLAGRTEAWALAELAELRKEHNITAATHEALAAKLATRVGADRLADIGVWVDAAPVANFRAAEQCVLRLRIRNDSDRPIASLRLVATTTASRGELTAAAAELLGPGEDDVLSVWFKPTVAGHHRADFRFELGFLRGAPAWWAAELPFLIGAAAALQQQIHIEAGSQRVGVFENIGAATKGGLITDADWRMVTLRPAAAPAASAAAREAAAAKVGAAGTALVVSAGDPPTVTLDGATGPLVDGLDVALRRRLRPGDKLDVHVMGLDGRGGPLFAVGPAPAAEAVGGDTVIVGPGDDLAAAVARAPAGTKIVIRGQHEGPVSVDRPMELRGEGGATLRAAEGPVLRLAADVVVRDLTVRGAAPEGQYAVDAIEVRSGRVVVEGCKVSADAPKNLVPGRAIAVAGAANLELRGCQIEGSGIGVAVDVSWSGFATDTARGARVKVVGCELVGVGVGVAVAGADRELRVVRTRFAAIGEAAVRALRGGSCVVEDCTVPKRLLSADPGADIVVKGSGT